MKREHRARVGLWSSLIVFALSSAALSPTLAEAQYRFGVPSMRLLADVQPDASVRLEYTIVFENFGQPIDVVDMGLPHDRYDIANMHATLDGEPVGPIARSTYIATGVEVQLGRHAIASGRGFEFGGNAPRGTFRFEATMPDLVFSDTTDDALASFRITPTWFDANLVQGHTALEVAVRLPEGADEGAILHQGNPFDSREVDETGRTVVTWRFPSTQATRSHMVAVSFSRASMTRVVEITRWDLFRAYWDENPGPRIVAFLLALIFFGVFFFRFSGGTGISVFIFGAVGYGVACYNSPGLHLYSVPIVIALAVWLEVRLRRKRVRYLPPIVSVQGGGIKRGLTAPEAAVLLEEPRERVVSLVLFGMMKKGLVEATSQEPLRLRTIDPLQTSVRKERRKVAAKLGLVVHTYEHAFLDAFRNTHGIEPALVLDDSHVRQLAASVADRVAGYDLKETRAYYRQIVERAWKEAESIGEAERRSEKVDQKFEWLWLEREAPSRFDAWERSGYAYRPIWVQPVGGGPIGRAASAASAGVQGPSLGTPSLGDVAGSFAGWAENTAGSFASKLMPARGGAADFSKIDKGTGDVIAAFFAGDGGGGGGSSGGGCACACAGCACACACAGGGR